MPSTRIAAHKGPSTVANFAFEILLSGCELRLWAGTHVRNLSADRDGFNFSVTCVARMPCSCNYVPPAARFQVGNDDYASLAVADCQRISRATVNERRWGTTRRGPVPGA